MKDKKLEQQIKYLSLQKDILHLRWLFDKCWERCSDDILNDGFEQVDSAIVKLLNQLDEFVKYEKTKSKANESIARNKDAEAKRNQLKEIVSYILVNLYPINELSDEYVLGDGLSYIIEEIERCYEFLDDALTGNIDVSYDT